MNHTVSTLIDGLGYSPLRLRTFFRLIGFDAVPPGETELSVNQYCLLWIFMLVDNLAFISADARTLLIEQVAATCTELGDGIVADPLLTPTLVIADNRFAICYNWVAWLDLTTGDYVRQPKPTALETRGYHLGTLVHRNLQALTLRKHEHANIPDDRS